MTITAVTINRYLATESNGRTGIGAGIRGADHANQRGGTHRCSATIVAVNRTVVIVIRMLMMMIALTVVVDTLNIYSSMLVFAIVIAVAGRWCRSVSHCAMADCVTSSTSSSSNNRSTSIGGGDNNSSGVGGGGGGVGTSSNGSSAIITIS